MEISELVKKNGGESVKFIMEWNGFSVFEMLNKEFLYDGLPFFVVANDEETRLCTEEETVEIIGAINEQRN